MARTGWHRLVEEDGAVVTVARRLPVRFDLGVEAELACARPVSLTRLAHQVRQDTWRALQDLRGFAPAVRVARQGDVLTIRAGGQVAGARVPDVLRARLAALLADPARRARWIAHAGRGRDA